MRTASALFAVAAAVAAVVAPVPASAVCDICAIQYSHKDASTPEPALNGTKCSRYASNACCSPEQIDTIFELPGGAALYGEEWRWDRCGPLSPACEEYLVAEACWYECDPSTGKHRRHLDCAASTDGNSWELFEAPIAASVCDGFYEACKNDRFCSANKTGDFFETSVEQCDSVEGALANCHTYEETYGSGQELCERIFGDAFRYETNESLGLTWFFDDNATNPNDVLLQATPFDHPPCNDSENDAWVEWDLVAAVTACELSDSTFNVSVDLIDDLDGDGDVDAEDLAVIKEVADFDNDGDVDEEDLDEITEALLGVDTDDDGVIVRIDPRLVALVSVVENATDVTLANEEAILTPAALDGASVEGVLAALKANKTSE